MPPPPPIISQETAQYRIPGQLIPAPPPAVYPGQFPVGPPPIPRGSYNPATYPASYQMGTFMESGYRSPLHANPMHGNPMYENPMYGGGYGRY
jgi:hypothetical protein